MTKVEKYKEGEGNSLFLKISNEHAIIKVTNVGCHILSIETRDRKGAFGDIVVGYANEEECLKDAASAGSLVGRVANRIAKGRFILNGEEYSLAVNLGENHIHGGNVGFNRKIFDTEILEDGVRFHGFSPDGEEGYPGNLTMDITYRLKNNELWIEYDADTDADTLINLTNHTYFNLTGGKDKIYHHQLQLKAETYAPIDETGIPTGQYLDVEGTPFDFLSMHEIGDNITVDDLQIHRGTGYDHPFILSGEEDQAILYEAKTGRQVSITTSLPVLQVYTGNYLGECISSKWGRPLEDRDGVAIEAEYLPDSIHQEENPRVILRKGDHYHEVTIYRFETD